MRCLALDVGDRRVGVAVSDESGFIASPLIVIARKSKVEDFSTIARLVREHDAGCLVIGHPLRADGTSGPQARRVERYAAALALSLEGEGLKPELVFWDEYLSTKTAQQAMITSGRRRRDRRARLDAVAAAVILQEYLDSNQPLQQMPKEGVCP